MFLILFLYTLTQRLSIYFLLFLNSLVFLQDFISFNNLDFDSENKSGSFAIWVSWSCNWSSKLIANMLTNWQAKSVAYCILVGTILVKGLKWLEQFINIFSLQAYTFILYFYDKHCSLLNMLHNSYDNCYCSIVWILYCIRKKVQENLL